MPDEKCVHYEDITDGENGTKVGTCRKCGRVKVYPPPPFAWGDGCLTVGGMTFRLSPRRLMDEEGS